MDTKLKIQIEVIAIFGRTDESPWLSWVVTDSDNKEVMRAWNTTPQREYEWANGEHEGREDSVYDCLLIGLMRKGYDIHSAVGVTHKLLKQERALYEQLRTELGF